MSFVPDHKFVYAIAGGEGLELIKELQQAEDNIMQKIHAALPQGLTASVRDSKYFSFFIQPGSPTPDPEQWQVRSDDNTAWPTDHNDIRTHMIAICSKPSIAETFNSICKKQSGGTDHPLAHDYSYEKLGDVYVIKCPEARQRNVFFVPEGSTVISADKYRKLKIKALKEPKIQIHTFKKP